MGVSWRHNHSLIVFFLILYLSSSYVVTNDLISSGFTTFLWFFSFIWALILPRKNTAQSTLFPFILLILLFLLSSIFNGEPIRALYLHLFTFTTGFVFAYKVGFEDFKVLYTKVMYLICMISIFFYLLFLLFPFLNSFNTVTNAVGNVASNLYLYISLHPGLRNCGLFWEPGAFQTFIAIALLFSLSKTIIDRKEIVVLVVSMITTFSTTGFVALIVLFAIYILSTSNIKQKSSAVFAVILCAGAFIYFAYDLLFDASGSFGKLLAFQERGGADSDTFDTVSVRYFSFILPIQAFLSSPLWGVGYDGLVKYSFDFTRGMNTCTMINWFAVYGLFWGVIMLIGFIRLSKCLGSNYISRFLIFVLFFIITCSENYVNNPIILMLALYGYSLMSHKKKIVSRSAV